MPGRRLPYGEDAPWLPDVVHRVRAARTALRPRGGRLRRRVHRRPAAARRGGGRAAPTPRSCAPRPVAAASTSTAPTFPPTTSMRGQLAGECTAGGGGADRVRRRGRQLLPGRVAAGTSPSTPPHTTSSTPCCRAAGRSPIATPYRRREECPPDRVEPAVHRAAERCARVARHPASEVETVRLRGGHDEPWSGFNYYRGDFRSRVAINADLPPSARPAAAPGRARGLSRPPHRALPQGGVW